MRTLFFILAVTFASISFADNTIAVDFRCLTTNGNNPIQLEWRVFSEAESKWASSYVKYKNSTQVIPLVLRSEEATEQPEGRPWEITSVWLEIFEGKISGEYEIITQGANIYGFLYTNLRNGKKTSFIQDNAAFDEAGCKWD